MTLAQLPEGAIASLPQRTDLKQQEQLVEQPDAIDPLSGRPYRDVYGFRPKATWHLKPALERNLWEFIASRDLAPDVAYQKRDEKAPLRGPPPHRPAREENFFIVTTATLPLALHAAWNYAFPESKMHWAPAWLMYHLCFIVFALLMIRRLHWYMAEYGCFDEQNRGRDITPDSDVNNLGRSIFIYTIFRSAAPFILAWRGDMANPFDGLSWVTPIKIGLWQIALDYFFYVYHRSTHEWDSLWWIHRKHHATKHPTPILSILADDVQECIEIFCVPFLATLVAPKMSFVEFHYTVAYCLYVEALGHSGIRAEWQHPLLGWILKPLGMELAVEDHDLHHRYGKSGVSYGKQTRIWDRVFSTHSDRIETAKY